MHGAVIAVPPQKVHKGILQLEHSFKTRDSPRRSTMLLYQLLYIAHSNANYLKQHVESSIRVHILLHFFLMQVDEHWREVHNSMYPCGCLLHWKKAANKAGHNFDLRSDIVFILLNTHRTLANATKAWAKEALVHPSCRANPMYCKAITPFPNPF